MGQRKRIWLISMRKQIRSLASLSGLRIRCCRELWCTSQTQSDPALLWLRCRPAAIAPIGPLAWERPNAMGVALYFLEPHLWHMEVPRLRVESELQLPACTTAHSNAGSLTHWVRPGIESESSDLFLLSHDGNSWKYFWHFVFPAKFSFYSYSDQHLSP